MQPQTKCAPLLQLTQDVSGVQSSKSKYLEIWQEIGCASPERLALHPAA